MDAISDAKNDQITPEPILSPGAKRFLEKSWFGRWGLRVGRAVRPVLRRWRDPVQHRIWIREFGFLLRNVALLNRPLTVRFGEVVLRLVPRGSTASDLWSGVRNEQYELLFLLRILEPGMIFFDIGASAGLFAIGAAKKIGGHGIFAFEPCASKRKLLSRNVLLNRVPGIHLESTALGDSVGESVPQFPTQRSDSLNTSAGVADSRSKTIGQAPMKMMDAFLAERPILRVDVMRLDMQGAELIVLRGARNLLGRSDAPIVLYEPRPYLTRGFGYHPVETLWLLESCGYALFTFRTATGEISELRSDFRYDSVVVAAKQNHPAYTTLRDQLK